MRPKPSGDCSLDGNGDGWVLVLTRIMEHPCEEVWQALTDADQLSQWGPFATDKNLTEVGAVRLTHINNPREDARQGVVLEVDPPRLLVFQWGPDVLRWELREIGEKTKLILSHRFSDRPMAPSYAAGWHLCLEGLAGTLAGLDMPSMVGSDAIKYGYKELYKEYEKEFDGPNETEEDK